MLALFRKPAIDRARRRRLQAAAHSLLGLADCETVKLNELACDAPGCPDLTTAVLVLRAGCRTDLFHIFKPLEAVEIADLVEVLSAPPHRAGSALQHNKEAARASTTCDRSSAHDL